MSKLTITFTLLAVLINNITGQYVLSDTEQQKIQLLSPNQVYGIPKNAPINQNVGHIPPTRLQLPQGNRYALRRTAPKNPRLNKRQHALAEVYKQSAVKNLVNLAGACKEQKPLQSTPIFNVATPNVGNNLVNNAGNTLLSNNGYKISYV